MIIISLLCILLNFSSTADVDTLTCNQLIEVVAQHDTATRIYRNRYKIPVVDKNGKMMFNVDLLYSDTSQKMILNPVRNCRFEASTEVTFTYSDQSQRVITSLHKDRSGNVEVLLDEEIQSELMTSKIISIAFDGIKYSYDVVLKPNQGRVVQDVINCIQR